jgi:type I restriction enzyme S subunit
MPSQCLKLFKQAKTVTMTTMDQDGLLRVDVPLPPIPLQAEFAAQVSAVERLKAAQRASLVKLDALFASLQHRAFRGEL